MQVIDHQRVTLNQGIMQFSIALKSVLTAFEKKYGRVFVYHGVSYLQTMESDTRMLLRDAMEVCSLVALCILKMISDVRMM